ncbi:MAG: hypothetical protein DCE90_02305 [Pseudanabaena sp.]|nr:MAG: hypothetical protein DCE90_02305 [Pseudanabaena sp.]
MVTLDNEMLLANPALSSGNPILQKYQSTIDLVARQNLRDIYGTIRRECENVTILKEYSQTLLNWQKPWFGRMTLEHDGVRTIVERFDMFGKTVGLFTTYDLVTFRIE